MTVDPPKARLAGKIALVTGGGCIGEGWGNGKAICVLFARHGAKVLVVDRNLRSAEATVAIIEGEGGEAAACEADVSVSAQVCAAVETCVGRFGRVDILLNNVGITALGDPVQTSEEDWDRVFAVNVKSAFLLAKHGLPELLKAGGGSIVNVSSGSSLRYGGVPYVSYAASKAALNQLTRHIGLIYADRGIRANCVLPGAIQTPMAYAFALKGYSSSGDVEEMRRKRAAISPTGAEGSAWDVANAALYLASDEAAYVNATLLVVDGGLTETAPGPAHVR
jgi:NAD(P)-dependent dehydrogenase (short-subunit alcohol dehydrogenase family)